MIRKRTAQAITSTSYASLTPARWRAAFSSLLRYHAVLPTRMPSTPQRCVLSPAVSSRSLCFESNSLHISPARMPSTPWRFSLSAPVSSRSSYSTSKSSCTSTSFSEDTRSRKPCSTALFKQCAPNSDARTPGDDPFDWHCVHTWRRAGVNTLWCLLGCSIGEFGTLGAFQVCDVSASWTTLCVLPIVNGLMTSVALETAILMRGPVRASWRDALQTALGMSFISMGAMEAAMELTDYLLTGTMQLQLWAIPFMLLSGFLVPLPYNYWRLKRFGKTCH